MIKILQDLLGKTDIDDRMIEFINKKKGELDENIRTRLTERYGETNIKGVGGDMADGNKKSVFDSILGDSDAPNTGLGEPPIAEETPPAPVEEITEPDPELIWSREEAKKDIAPEVLDYVEDRLLPETRKYKIPDSLAASQWAIEGGRDMAEERPNPFGLMRDGEVLNYGSFEQNVKAYYQTIEGIVSTNLGISREEFNIEDYTADELLYYLQFQEDGTEGKQRYEAHKADPGTYIEMNKNMSEWRYYSSL